MVTVAFHAGQIQGFFNCPVDNLFASRCRTWPLLAMKGEIVVVSRRWRRGIPPLFAKRIEAPLAIIDKRRDRPNQTALRTSAMDGKIAVLVDDIIDAAGRSAPEPILFLQGAREVYACARTAFRPRPRAAQQLGVHQVVVTDTIPSGSLNTDVLEAAGRFCGQPSRQEHPQHPHPGRP